jgi:hypothetical protein
MLDGDEEWPQTRLRDRRQSSCDLVRGNRDGGIRRQPFGRADGLAPMLCRHSDALPKARKVGHRCPRSSNTLIIELPARRSLTKQASKM